MCADVSADAYCDRLVEQSSGILTVEVIYLVATVLVTVSLCLGCGLLTACCSCWCCCARSGRCATASSRACHRGCASCVSTFGCGWCAPPPPLLC